ncbi:MAG: PAS domain-containing protein [Candidatus Yanofskybacteria bacterium]|nr:PAS domain-containing protein [Candidatus Yanofskybacteria bacterium]
MAKEKEVRVALNYANSIIATLRESFLVINKNLQVVSVNSSFYTTFKVTEKETIGQLLPNLGNGQWNIPKLIHLLKEVLPQKTVVTNYEIEHEFETIGYRIMNLNAVQLRIPKKITTLITAKTEEEEEEEEELILVAIEDITDRRKIERQLAVLQTKEEAILASIGDAAMACEKNGQIVLFNGAAEKLTGYSAKEVIGHHYSQVFKFVRESDEKPINDFISETIITGQEKKMTGHVLLIIRDGRKIPVADSVGPIKNVQGEVVGCVVILRDITKEKEIDRSKSEFISIASHQLRTPVSALSWLVEALQFNSKNFNPKQKTYLLDLSSMTKRLIRLVEDLLDFSRLQIRSAAVTEKHKIEIPAFIEEFIKEIETYAVSKKHKVILNNKITQPLIIEINKKALYNVLQNLVSNGIEYSPENTAVTINLEKTEDSIKISIFNKGPTIPKEEKPHLFERFYRGESAKKIKADGTGMGLYIAKKEIEDINGKIGLESVEGKDTVFWFTIPLTVTNESKIK